MAHADSRIFFSQGKILADRRQEKYISTELGMGEDFHFAFCSPVSDSFLDPLFT